MGSPGPKPKITLDDTLEVFEESDGRRSKPLTATEVAEELGCTRRTAHRKLDGLTKRGDLETKKVGASGRVWWRPIDADESSRSDRQKSQPEQFQEFVQAVEDYAIFALDPEGHVQSWNEGARSVKGYEKNEILGEHFSLFYTEDDVDRGIPSRNLDAAVEHGRVEDEGWRVRADGSEFWADVVITAIRDENGSIQGFTKITRDLTERKRAEDEHELQHSVSTSIARADSLEDGLETAIGRVCELTDWEYGEAWFPVGEKTTRSITYAETAALEPFAEASVEEAAERGSGFVGRVRKAGESAWIADVTEVSEDVFHRTDLAKAVGLKAALCVPVPSGDDVPVVFLFSMTEAREVDERSVETIESAVAGVGGLVTERKERERQLERFERMVETVNDGVYATDGDGRFVFVNDAFVSMSQHAREELLGAHGSILFGEAFVDTDDEEWRELIDGERDAVAYETDIIGPNDEPRVVHNQLVPIEINNEVGHVGVTRDITELKEYQRKLEESNERLEQFAYVASHDLQEPLRMVSSYLQLLEDRYADQLDEDAEEFIDFAVDGAERMREMIEGLLAYSRVDTEAKPFEPTDCEAALENVLTDLRVQIEENDADIDVGSLPTVHADRNQLEQVFRNLVSNAIKYRGDDPPEIRIGADRDGGEWVFRVADNGIGMDPDRIDRIFDVFERLHTDEEYSGTGIGLALCQKIVDRHGGDIWVESEPGAGSTFYFTVPDSTRSRALGDRSDEWAAMAEEIDD